MKSFRMRGSTRRLLLAGLPTITLLAYSYVGIDELLRGNVVAVLLCLALVVAMIYFLSQILRDRRSLRLHEQVGGRLVQLGPMAKEWALRGSSDRTEATAMHLRRENAERLAIYYGPSPLVEAHAVVDEEWLSPAEYFLVKVTPRGLVRVYHSRAASFNRREFLPDGGFRVTRDYYVVDDRVPEAKPPRLRQLLAQLESLETA